MLCTSDQRKVLAEVRESPFFSVVADEAADISNKEQLPIVLWFIGNDSTFAKSSLTL